MRIPLELYKNFPADLEGWLGQFGTKQGYLERETDLQARRFITRSVAPHVAAMSDLFNRLTDENAKITPYWTQTKNISNRVFAYAVGFAPPNAARMATVVAELSRLGFAAPSNYPQFKVLELGAGTGAGSLGFAAGATYTNGAPSFLDKKTLKFALIEQSRPSLQFAEGFLSHCFQQHPAFSGFQVEGFSKVLDSKKKELLPKTAPKFNAIISSFFFNELDQSAETWAAQVQHLMEHHLEENGLMILVEPALKAQARRVQAMRKVWIEKGLDDSLGRILLPCFGAQACGALANPDDWCHEQMRFRRPRSLEIVDEAVGLDRKLLSFSYLVLCKSKKSRQVLLPMMKEAKPESTYRLVSPAFRHGPDLEFFLCGPDGKRKARFRQSKDSDIDRGDFLIDAELRGDVQASRIEKARRPVTLGESELTPEDPAE